MITMTELAKMTGVSQATVSRVLNGNTSVKPEVAAKVLDYARKYNYQPNMIARSLNGNRTFLLAAIVPDISNPFFADIIKEIEKGAEKAGYSILIFNSDYSQEKEQKYLNLLQQYRVDGLLVAPVHNDEKSIQPFRKLTIPWMVITKKR
ncbi:MAG: LacI family DNA-binding transcriptional regulator [Lachnospiraceae bacterium]|nr:LacI family DNA-binding transcriptional regulator [Lachnospiraceae bacterium]MBP3458974.1 LacI family DNA-binding transcriptional regulator [Lachnospiraceae bacterium]